MMPNGHREEFQFISGMLQRMFGGEYQFSILQISLSPAIERTTDPDTVANCHCTICQILVLLIFTVLPSQVTN